VDLALPLGRGPIGRDPKSKLTKRPPEARA